LLARWHDHGLADEEARAKVAANDMPNAGRVLARRRAADMIVGDGEEL
jgi:pantothenate kinase